MRWLSIVFAWLAIPAIAFARPKVAVVALDGDDDGKVTDVVVEAAAEHAKVTGPKQVGKAAEALGLSDPTTPRSLKKLRGKLEVDAVIHGKVEREGGKKKVVLSVSGKGKRGEAFEVPYKSATSKSFKKELREELGKRLSDAEGGKEDDADDDPPKKKDVFDDSSDKKKPTDDDTPEKKKPKASDDDDAKPKRVAKRSDDDDSTRVRKRSSDDEDEDKPHKKKKHHRSDEDEPPPRHPVTQGAVWVDAGGAGLHRTLTYGGTGTGAPPPVGTGSFSGELEGEIYPFSFDDVHKPEAGIGLAGSFGRTVGLSITVPGTTASASINEGHYTIGARYRFVFGQSSISAGISYWRREFIADRSSLMGQTLDMPDVDYRAIAPEVVAKFPATPTIGITVQADVPLMLASGDITSGMRFGVASIIAFGFEGAVDIALAPHYGLRFAGLFDQVQLTFQQSTRGVSSAVDRSMGITATFALLY